MTSRTALVSLLLIGIIVVHCHTNMISINGDRSCVRPFSNDSPVMDIYNDVMRCNNQNNPAGGRCSVAAGSEVTLRWYHGGTGSIDPSHKGPIAVYLAEASTGGYGDSWFKIAEDGYSGGRWAVERLVASGGYWKVRIPSELRGDYIVRTELIAHHESFRANGAQYYIGCADIHVTGGSGGDCSPKVAIPGSRWVPNYDDATVKVDIYNGMGNGYRVPGPQMANCAGGGGGGNHQAPPPAPGPVYGGHSDGLHSGGVYFLHPQHASDKCLDAGGESDGAGVQIYGCWSGANNQKWRLDNHGDGWSLTEQRSGRSLDVWQSYDNGALTQLWRFGGGPNQLWYPEHHGDGTFAFKGKFSGKYLDVAGGSTQNAAKVHQWDWLNAANQKWILKRA